MGDAQQPGICLRLAELRARQFGARGKSRFARELGIGSSTYDRYERDRIPPAELLLKAAKITDVRLEWLITGDGPRETNPVPSDRSAQILERVRSLLERREDLAGRFEPLLAELEAEVDR